MNEILKSKSAGFYFMVLAGIAAIVSMIRFLLWAPNHGSMDGIIIIALAAGIVLDIILAVKDNEYMIVASTACYSIALVKLLANSVGSFVDAFQGIQMFGDATQVSTIISISEIMAVSVLLSIVSGFLKRIKD